MISYTTTERERGEKGGQVYRERVEEEESARCQGMEGGLGEGETERLGGVTKSE